MSEEMKNDVLENAPETDDILGSFAAEMNLPSAEELAAEMKDDTPVLDQSAAALKGFAAGFPKTWALTPDAAFVSNPADYIKKLKAGLI